MILTIKHEGGTSATELSTEEEIRGFFINKYTTKEYCDKPCDNYLSENLEVIEYSLVGNKMCPLVGYMVSHHKHHYSFCELREDHLILDVILTSFSTMGCTKKTSTNVLIKEVEIHLTKILTFDKVDSLFTAKPSKRKCIPLHGYGQFNKLKFDRIRFVIKDRTLESHSKT